MTSQEPTGKAPQEGEPLAGQEPTGKAPQAASRPKRRTRRRAAAKAPIDIDPQSKRSLNLRIDVESYRRLSVHALMTDRTISDIVMEFAKSLRDYSMPHRLGGGAGTTREEGEGEEG